MADCDFWNTLDLDLDKTFDINSTPTPLALPPSNPKIKRNSKKSFSREAKPVTKGKKRALQETNFVIAPKRLKQGREWWWSNFYSPDMKSVEASSPPVTLSKQEISTVLNWLLFPSEESPAKQVAELLETKSF